MGSSPGWTYGFVPTPGQWSAAFAAKQDDLGYTPVNRSGDSMAGRLVTFGSTPSQAGFNVSLGVAPNAPDDGDIWMTTAGFYGQVNGATVGPFASGSVTSVALTAPAQFTVAGSPVTSTGTLALSWAVQTANHVLAGPATGANAAPTFRALVGDDLPDPGASSKGGVEAYTAPANEFLTAIGTDGIPTSAEPDVPAILGYTPLDPANNLSDVASASTALTNIGGVGLASTNVFTASQQWAEGAAIASASTLTLGTDGNFFHVTGTTTINAISGTPSPVQLCFNSALTLTNGANLVLPNGANIAVGANDVATFVFEGAGVWRLASYTSANAQIPIITKWVAYTPTFTGFGTVAAVSVWSRRVGSNLEVSGRFTSGTPSGSDASITLGFNGTNGNVNVSSRYGSLSIPLGTVNISIAVAASYYVIAFSTGTAVFFSIQSSTRAGNAKAPGNAVANAADAVSFCFSVPIAEWE